MFKKIVVVVLGLTIFILSQSTSYLYKYNYSEIWKSYSHKALFSPYTFDAIIIHLYM